MRQLSGGLERVKGIEPSYAAWEAAVLPLNYTRGRALIVLQATPGAGLIGSRVLADTSRRYRHGVRALAIEAGPAGVLKGRRATEESIGSDQHLTGDTFCFCKERGQGCRSTRLL